MYRRPKFLEVLLEIRQEMAREADYDVDLFAEMVRGGSFSEHGNEYNLNGEENSKFKIQDSKSKTKNPKS